ncbi:MAG TPA: hypothetical protein VHF26_02640 [Trebonia sp.]|nr:hypothetical protein [Trebonia sp.]
MSLAPGEERTLAGIESELSRSDPGLAGMFALLAADGIRKLIVRRCLRRQGSGADGRIPVTIRVVVRVALLMARMAAAMAVASCVGLPR